MIRKVHKSVQCKASVHYDNNNSFNSQNDALKKVCNLCKPVDLTIVIAAFSDNQAQIPSNILPFSP